MITSVPLAFLAASAADARSAVMTYPAAPVQEMTISAAARAADRSSSPVTVVGDCAHARGQPFGVLAGPVGHGDAGRAAPAAVAAASALISRPRR